jgi:hypothetical protein
MMRATWVLTVAPLMTSAEAISAFDIPRASRRRTSSSRSVSLVSRVRARGSRSRRAELGDDTAGHRWREQRIAACDDADRVEHVGGGCILQDEPAGPGVQGLEDVLVVVERREDEDPGRRTAGEDAPGGLEPVEPRHADVHEDDVGSPPGGQRDGLEAVGGLADHLEVRLAGEQQPEPAADHLLVVRQQDADRHVGPPEAGSQAATR